MKIYISIPISGCNIQDQSGLALSVAEKLKELGHEPINPFDTPTAPINYNEKEMYAYYMGRDIEQLLLCDAILFCDRLWPNSKGCRAEHNISDVYGIKKYFKLEDIPNERMESDG